MKSGTSNKHGRNAFSIVQRIIDQSDIILEILDARFISETRNLVLEETINEKGKKIIYVLNKLDLVDLPSLHKNLAVEGISPFVLFSSKERKGLKNLRTRIKIEAKKILKNKTVRTKFDNNAYIGVIGYPNTGKSSVINLLVGKSVAGVSSVSGYTKGEKKLKLTRDIMLIDTPGVIPREDMSNPFSRDIKKHGLIGVETYQKAKNPDFIVSSLMEKYPGLIESYYKIKAEGDSEILIEQLGRKKQLLRKGNLVDIDRTARLILRDWQEGKIIVKSD